MNVFKCSAEDASSDHCYIYDCAQLEESFSLTQDSHRHFCVRVLSNFFGGDLLSPLLIQYENRRKIKYTGNHMVNNPDLMIRFGIEGFNVFTIWIEYSTMLLLIILCLTVSILVGVNYSSGKTNLADAYFRGFAAGFVAMGPCIFYLGAFFSIYCNIFGTASDYCAGSPYFSHFHDWRLDHDITHKSEKAFRKKKFTVIIV